jgi:hypothetical protein
MPTRHTQPLLLSASPGVDLAALRTKAGSMAREMAQVRVIVCVMWL